MLTANNVDTLDRAISQATGEARSILRNRWPASWPFGEPPDEVREAVAVLAVYRAVRGPGVGASQLDLIKELRQQANEARAWLERFIDCKEHLVFGGGGKGGWAVGAGPPRGEFGFGR
jgi:hypothetical protein